VRFPLKFDGLNPCVRTVQAFNHLLFVFEAAAYPVRRPMYDVHAAAALGAYDPTLLTLIRHRTLIHASYLKDYPWRNCDIGPGLPAALT
jgi:hypothetical protein